MEPNWASENLQVIRTLMERSALYRHALGPALVWAGCLGIAAAVAGNMTHIESPRSFALYWTAVCCVVSLGAFLLLRKQAIKDAEPFWSPPTRRVAQAAMPALFLGAVIATLFVLKGDDDSSAELLLPPVWMMVYGCALHAAGFFMKRGIRLFGWLFVIGGTVLLCAVVMCEGEFAVSANTVMGFSFGAFHLAYGLYLYFTEKRKNAA